MSFGKPCFVVFSRAGVIGTMCACLYLSASLPCCACPDVIRLGDCCFLCWVFSSLFRGSERSGVKVRVVSLQATTFPHCGQRLLQAVRQADGSYTLDLEDSCFLRRRVWRDSQDASSVGHASHVARRLDVQRWSTPARGDGCRRKRPQLRKIRSGWDGRAQSPSSRLGVGASALVLVSYFGSLSV